VLVLNPDTFTCHLPDDVFYHLKQTIDTTVCHIVGEVGFEPWSIRSEAQPLTTILRSRCSKIEAADL